MLSYCRSTYWRSLAQKASRVNECPQSVMGRLSGHRRHLRSSPLPHAVSSPLTHVSEALSHDSYFGISRSTPSNQLKVSFEISEKLGMVGYHQIYSQTFHLASTVAIERLASHLGDREENAHLTHFLMPVSFPEQVSCLHAAGVRRLICVSSSRQIPGELLSQVCFSDLEVEYLASTERMFYAFLFSDRFYGDGGFKSNLLVAQPWHDGVCARIVGSLSNSKSINHLLFCVGHRASLFSQGRVELLVYITENIFQYMYPCSEHRSSRAFICRYFTLLFDVEVLDSLSSGHFKQLNSSFEKCFDEQLLLVRVTPRKDSPVPDIHLPAIQPFFKYVRYNGSSNIIADFENYIPGCGYRLILSGIDVFQQFVSLSYQDTFDLFLIMTSWPEYPDSEFYHLLNSADQRHSAV